MTLTSPKKVNVAREKYLGAHLIALWVIFFSILMLVSLAVNQLSWGDTTVLIPALVVAVFSLYSFFVCGKQIVNASSVASYGVLMFVGFPAIYGALDLYESRKAYSDTSLTAVLILAFLFQGGLLLAANSKASGESPHEFRVQEEDTDRAMSQVLRFSILVFGLFLVSLFAGVGAVATGSAWVVMLGGTVVAFWSTIKSTQFRGFALTIGAFVLQTGLSLGSFGRLNLAVLALSLVVIVSLRKKTWTIKTFTVVMTGPILVYLVSQRVSFLQEQRGSAGQVSETEGLGSVVGPFHSAGTIAEAWFQGEISPVWGETLFNAAVTGVPRAVWPDKPVGFGREIVDVTQPWLLSSEGFSDAGTFIGESIWNFGVWLAPAYLLGFIVLIRMLDKKIESSGVQGPDFAGAVALMIVALLAGTLLNIIWGSFSTAAARSMIPLTLLISVWIYARQIQSPRNINKR